MSDFIRAYSVFLAISSWAMVAYGSASGERGWLYLGAFLAVPSTLFCLAIAYESIARTLTSRRAAREWRRSLH